MFMTRRRSTTDRGFTLIELLISVAIIGVIAVPLSDVVISFFKNTTTTRARLNESHDQQITNAYWQQDVASIGLRDTTYNPDPAVHTYPSLRSVNLTLACNANLPAGTKVITLSWNQYDASANQTQIGVAYVAQASGTRYLLLRAHCTGSTVDSLTTLAHNLTAVPTVTCAGGGVTGCNDTNATAVPTTVSLGMNISDPSGRGEPYDATFTGERRQT